MKRLLFTAVETPPNIRYHTPNGADYDEDITETAAYGSSTSHVHSIQNILPRPELEAFTPYVDPSEVQHEQFNAPYVHCSDIVLSDARLQPPVDEEQHQESDTTEGCSRDPLDLFPIILARRFKSSQKPITASRLYLRALFQSFHPMYQALDYATWNECLDELIILFSSPDISERQMKIIFRDEFWTSTYSSHLDLDPGKNEFNQRLRYIWQGFLSYSIRPWLQNSKDVCELFIESFSRSKRWRCRLELAKTLSRKRLDQEGHHQLVLSLYECFIQWKTSDDIKYWQDGASKIFREPVVRKYLLDVFLDARVIVYEASRGNQQTFCDHWSYLIAGLAFHCFSKSWWTIGHELMDAIQTDLQDRDYDRRWLFLYLDLFEVYYKNDLLSEAATIISRAFKMINSGSLISKAQTPGWEYRWQRRWSKFSNSTHHSGLSTSTREQITEISNHLGKPDERDLPLSLVDSDDIEIGARAIVAEDRDESSFGDCESAAYGITYTESLFSGLSLDYTALFPQECRS
jgi:hypothetical protein